MAKIPRSRNGKSCSHGALAETREDRQMNEMESRECCMMRTVMGVEDRAEKEEPAKEKE